MKLKIRVSNPAGQRLTYITLKSARWYVARGRAKLLADGSIMFLEGTHDRLAAEQSAMSSKIGYDRISGVMTSDQLRGLPLQTCISGTDCIWGVTNSTKGRLQRIWFCDRHAPLQMVLATYSDQASLKGRRCGRLPRAVCERGS